MPQLTDVDIRELTEQIISGIEKKVEAIVDKRFDKLDGKIDLLENKLINVEKELSALDKRFDKLDGRIDLLENKLANVEKGLSPLDTRLLALDTRLWSFLITIVVAIVGSMLTIVNKFLPTGNP